MRALFLPRRIRPGEQSFGFPEGDAGDEPIIPNPFWIVRVLQLAFGLVESVSQQAGCVFERLPGLIGLVKPLARHGEHS